MSLLRLRGWSVVGVATLVLWLWNWPLAIAAASGIAMMAGVYWLQRQSWQAKLQQLQHWLSASHQALVIPPFCGGIAAIGAYLAAMMLAETASPWTVLAVGLEGVGLVCLMAVVLLQWLSRPQANLDDRLDRALTELNQPEPMQRVIALRQIDRLLTHAQTLDAQQSASQRITQRRLLQTAVEICARDDAEPGVRELALDILQRLY